ncbi:MAG: response regulator [Janthinobacterium lividum]
MTPDVAVPAAGLFRRFGLFTRLLILVAAVSLPSFAVIGLLVLDLREERNSRPGKDALHEAELISNAVGSTTEAARQMMLAVASGQAVRALDPACADQLALLRRTLPAYAFVTVLDGDLRAVCGAGAGGAAAAPAGEGGGARVPDAVAHTARLVLGGADFVVDRYAVGGEGEESFLGLGAAVRAADGRVVGVVVAGLSLEAMARTAEAMLAPGDRAIVLADREGTVLARVPRLAGAVGQPFRPETRFLLDARQPGVATIRAPDGVPRLVGFVPPTGNGLYVGVGRAVEVADTELVSATRRGVVFAVGAALLALGSAIVFGQSYVRRPTGQLLAAAVRWRGGDLEARAELSEDPRTEFGSLAAAFNDMAEALGRQRGELEALNGTLEGRVEERTRALSASHNRLQVQTAERELSDSRLRQAQKLQAVGELAGGMAHDFNNLLGVVIGSLDLLRRRVGAGEAGQQQLIAGAIAAAERGARLTAQLIGFSRRQRLLPQPCELNAVVAAMRPMLSTTLGPGVALVLLLDPAGPVAMVDPNQLDTAILNLAINAREAMPQGGTLTVATGGLAAVQDDAVAEEGAADGLVAVSVADTGAGIAADVLGRVFEPFFTTKGPGRGSGLGLSQVHGLARQSGGDVRIASEPERGTRVVLLLPRAGVLAAMAAPAGASRRILVVDDEADVRALTAEMLEEDGHVVLVASGGEEALRLLEGGPVDLLLADYVMPGMNGVELLRRAAEVQPGVRAMLVTGYAELGGAEGMGGLRTEQVLRKPFRTSELLRRVDLVLAGAKEG